MALVKTTISSAVGVTDTQITVASATTVAADRLFLIDQEIMRVAKGYTSGTTVPVLRGVLGTVTVAHVVTANAVHGLPEDFDLPSPGGPTVPYQSQWATNLISITATSTLTLPSARTNTTVVLNGTSVIALTVPVPTTEMDGCELNIVANGVAAHTVTFTGGLSGAGGSYDVITINASAPSAFKVVACNALWVAYCQPAMGGTVTNLIGSIA